MAAPLPAEQIPAPAVRSIRRAVLRPHQPPEASVYPLDEAPGTAHFGAFRAGRLIGVASVFHEARPGTEDASAWRLRGMATLPEVRGDGHGAALLHAVMAYVLDQKGRTLWCNARLTAAGFYKRHGMVPTGAPFDLPGLGPHTVLVWQPYDGLENPKEA